MRGERARSRRPARSDEELAILRVLQSLLLDPASRAAWTRLSALYARDDRAEGIAGTPISPRLDVGHPGVRADLERAFAEMSARLRAGGRNALADD